ncbi:MAG TPA: Hsp20/alpha crystallin family protein [Rhodocyclaceae bacterium]|nr:Hsp20/alpha crystallin family protein [Rhodocyclaceae bacterium]
MTKLAEQLKHGADQAWESLAEGWHELSSRATGALTRFRPAPASGAAGQSGERAQQNENQLPFGGWAFMASDVLDDDDRVIVRIEAPGMQREDFNIELHGNTLAVWGEKRSDREVKHGRHSVVQCAYGSFRRNVALPVAVKAEETKATYRDGVLRVELPKAEALRTKHISVKAA